MPADTYYSRHCGGTTEAGGAPYLKQLQDTFCVATGRAEWHCELRKQDVGGPVAILSRTPSGRVSEVRAAGRRVRASDFQLTVGRTLGWDTIRSNFYEIIDRGDSVRFEGYGAGHGIGLCQIGAEQRGEQGHNYRQILAFYFPGTAPGVGAQGFYWTRMQGERAEVWSTNPNEDRHAVAAAAGCCARRRAAAAFAAASTTLRTSRMQPAAVLRGSGSLDSTLLQEMLHVLVETRRIRSRPGGPTSQPRLRRPPTTTSASRQG
jgi:stage II sporulation protein D